MPRAILPSLFEDTLFYSPNADAQTQEAPREDFPLLRARLRKLNNKELWASVWPNRHGYETEEHADKVLNYIMGATQEMPPLTPTEKAQTARGIET